mmetsp:Transcript_12908/g.22134  ORF Transcript_12908/g.22134 Transcript_12908/m.22134 type:complete len:103 (+) Transcript_12908:85-393(+)
MEKQIGPGIYFTPARPSTTTSSSTDTQSQTHKPVDIDLLSYDDLIREKEELERAIFMLQKSNQYMMEEDPEQKDPDLVVAIQENVDCIAVKTKRLELIKQRI